MVYFIEMSQMIKSSFQGTRCQIRASLSWWLTLTLQCLSHPPRYVKTYLLPDRSNHSKRKTAVKKRSLDPIFNETLKVREKQQLLMLAPTNQKHSGVQSHLSKAFQPSLDILSFSWNCSSRHFLAQWFGSFLTVSHSRNTTELCFCSRKLTSGKLFWVPLAQCGSRRTEHSWEHQNGC